MPRLNGTANSLAHRKGTFLMTTISIIGSGNMATAIGTRAAKHGHTIEFMSRNTAKAQALADQIGNGATAGERPQPAALQGLRLGQATCSRIPVRDRLPGLAAQRGRNPCPAGTMGS